MILKFILITIFTFISFAQVDYSLSGSLRTYTKGVAVVSDAGYGYKFWEKDKIMYGYIRPSINLQTSILVNYASAQLDFYPVSFIGFYAGKSIGAKSIDELQGIDCKSIKCDGGVSKNYYGTNIALALSKIKFIHTFKLQQIDLKNHQGLFAEEFSNLIGRDKDVLITNTSILGFQASENSLLGLIYLQNNIKNNNQSSSMQMLLYQYKYENSSYGVAVGNHKNRFDHDHLSMLFLFKWDPQKGVRLF